MASSPGHQFGQIIGDLLEMMLRDPLRKVADRHGLYLDHKHPRPARNGRRKVAWTDHKGNVHDLDYVFERGGSETEIGAPKAFIESAWRRYTKHSRNKAQEIQGAIVPLVETYSQHYPFLGVVLAGVFTEGSLQQLRSHGFSILHFPYEVVCKAFSTVGIDARFDEDTSDEELLRKVAAFKGLSQRQRRKLTANLLKARALEFTAFLHELETSLSRSLSRIHVLALHGPSAELHSVIDAVRFIEGYDELRAAEGFVRYEIQAEYSNGDTITGTFHDKATALQFLRGLH